MQQPWYRKFGSFMRDTYRHFIAVRPTRIASSLSYYGLFALVPILIITFWIGSSIVDSVSLQNAIITQVSHVFGSTNSSFIATVFKNAQHIGGQWWKAVLAIGGLVILAVSGMGELKQSIDDVWETPYNSTPGFAATFGRYVISIAATVAFAIVFIIFILGSRFLEAGITFGIPESMLNFLTAYGAPIVLFLVASVMIFFAFAFLPERRLPKRFIFLGSVVTGIFLTLGNIALGVYLAQSSTVATYGIAGSVVAILLWFYYSALMFIFGASITWTTYDRSRISNQ